MGFALIFKPMDKDKKILFDGRFLSLSHAGIGRYSCELLKHLLPLDEDQKFIFLVGKGAKLSEDLLKVMNERKNPVEVIETDIAHYTIAEQTKLLFLLKKLRPALIHFPHFNHPILYRGDFVVTIHDLTLSQFSENGSSLKRKGYHLAIKNAGKRSKKILTVSDFVKNSLIQEFSLPASKIVTTYNAVDESFRKITNPRYLKKVEKYGLDKPFILSLGQWRIHKNLPALVEAFAKIIQSPRWKGKLDLVFVGRKDPNFPYLKQKINELKVKNQVKLTGFVPDEDLPLIYNSASAFVFPSFAEGFGLPGLEAQACGLPLISSNRTCLPEIFGDGALYFNPENIVDMEKKIQEVLEDDQLRNKLINLGFQNVKRFSWEETAKKTLDVYRGILYKKVS